MNDMYFIIDACKQLRAYWEMFHSCPCGARKESLNTHPHNLGCPTDVAIIFLDDLEKEEFKREG